MKTMTPVCIEQLLRAYYQGIPLKLAKDGAPAVRDAIASLEADDLIERRTSSTDEFCCTERGKAHVLQLSALPLPTKQWIGADGAVIK